MVFLGGMYRYAIHPCCAWLHPPWGYLKLNVDGSEIKGLVEVVLEALFKNERVLC